MCYRASVTRKVSGRRANGDPTRPTFVRDTRMPDATSSYPSRFNGRHHTVYRRARDEAFARSRGVCQGCGQQPAVEVHHWAHQYPPAHATTADDLCADCHRLTTTLRRFTSAGGSRYQLLAFFSEAVAKCDFNSPLPASRPSSCTTSRPDSTREVLSAVRSQRSRRRRAATAPTSTTSGSRSSSVSGPSISALTASPRYRRQRFGP